VLSILDDPAPEGAVAVWAKCESSVVLTRSAQPFGASCGAHHPIGPTNLDRWVKNGSGG
jgi:hypothetical protein